MVKIATAQFYPKESSLKALVPEDKLRALDITVTVNHKPIVMDEPISPIAKTQKASRSYSTDSSDENQHKAKKFKRSNVTSPHLIGYN
jgi:hypothetical protein